MDQRAIAESLFNDPSRGFAVELWDGSVLPPGSQTPGEEMRVIIRSRDAVSRLIPPVDESLAAEAFIEDEIDFAGDIVRVVNALANWRGPSVPVTRLPSLALAWLQGRAARDAHHDAHGRLHSRRRDARAVRGHYDLSDEFFELFLDESKTYSCAYFPTGRESLHDAQRAKLELVCRKLELRFGERLLDIGCGWGSLLEHAALRHGAAASGTTLSQNQYRAAQARADKALERGARIEVLQRDYRDLPGGPYDKLVSVGMMEHVGRQKLRRYFAEAHRLLKPGGLFLNHAIAQMGAPRRTVPWMHRSSAGFIRREIFPDTDLPPLALVTAAAESEGFEVRDVDNLREHYAETLERWTANLNRRFADAERLVGRARARAFKLYLAASAVAFRRGEIGVYQVLLYKPGRPAPRLTTYRGDWYRTPLVQKTPN
jgi:cyclopropane-fatty-acyl-phospholipid synthase